MKTKVFSLTLAVALALIIGGIVHADAPTVIDNTTFAAALTGTGTPQSPFERVVSLTAITCTGCTFGKDTLIYAEGEAMRVTAAYTSGTTNIPVTRGTDGTKPGPHNTSAVVFLGPGNRFYRADPPLGSGCVRATFAPYLPWINLVSTTGNIYTCDLSGKVIATNAVSVSYNSTMVR